MLPVPFGVEKMDNHFRYGNSEHLREGPLHGGQRQVFKQVMTEDAVIRGIWEVRRRMLCLRKSAFGNRLPAFSMFLAAMSIPV